MVSKKKKRSSPILRLNLRPKSQIQSSFPPKIRWSPKTKKKVFTDFETDCSAQLENPNVSRGAIFNFSLKIDLKTTKRCDFAYFTSQWGGSSPPPPLTTLLAGGTMTRGPMDFREPMGFRGLISFRGPSREPMGFRGPIEMTLRNQHVEDQRPFLFLEIISKS